MLGCVARVTSAPQDIVALAERACRLLVPRATGRTADELKARIEAAGWRVVDCGIALRAAGRHDRRTSSRAGRRSTARSIRCPPGWTSRRPAPLRSWSSPARTACAPGRPCDALAATAPPAPRCWWWLDAGHERGWPRRRGHRDGCTVQRRRCPARRPCDERPGQSSSCSSLSASPAATSSRPLGEALARCLASRSLASTGLHSTDLHRYRPAERRRAPPPLRSGCYAFRRADAIARGPIDGRLHLRGSVAAWLGLLLRDEGPDGPPRRALALDLPLDDSETMYPRWPTITLAWRAATPIASPTASASVTGSPARSHQQAAARR